MRGSTVLGFALSLLIAVPFTLGCALEASDEAESDATAGATTIASSLESPGNLAIVGDQIVFSTAHFVASGDPELDQEYAYWTGELWAKPLAGGAKKRFARPAGAVWSTASVGENLLVVDSGYSGVTRFAMPAGKESDFYNDYSHFPDDTGEFTTISAVAAGGGDVFVTRTGSEVLRMKTDGSHVETFAKTFKSGWAEHARQIVVLKDAIFWATEKEGEAGSTYYLFRASRGGATHTPKKLATYAGEIRSLATDGTRVFVAIAQKGTTPGEIDVVPGDGSKAPRALVADQPSPDDLVSDALGLFFTDAGKNLVGLVPAAELGSAAAVKPVKVLSVKAPTSIALSDDHLYVASDPGSTNQKKGSILRLAREKIKTH